VLVEGRYTIAPAVFVAGRVECLAFEHLTGQLLDGDTWDADVWRLEVGVGYALRRNLRLKGGYQHNWRDGGPRHSAGLFALQAALRF
jgi:predicted porin